MSTLPAPTPSLPARRAWAGELGRRAMRLQWLKTPGITAFIWLFFIGYFALLRQPNQPVTVMPTTWLDDWVGFSPPWLPVYLSLWLYVGIPPGLMWRFRELVVYALWSAALAITGLACFYFWPTAVPAVVVDVVAHPGFALLQGVDAPGNACPSMHVAAAVFTVPWLWRLLRAAGAPLALQALNVTWGVAIVYSTLAVKQHVALDALAGALLGSVFAVVSLACTPPPAPITKP